MTRLFTTIAVLIFATSLQAADWPEFMGPDRNNISVETEWNATWSGKSPKILWKADLGIGFSGVSVVGDRAFTVGGNKKAKTETIFCFNALTGDVIWKKTYTSEPIPLFHVGGPNAAPTIKDGKIYSLSKDGKLFCLNAKDGSEVWTTNTYESMGLEKMTRWGFSSAPWIDRGEILLQSNRIVAVNASDGSIAWKSAQSHMPGYCSVAMFQHNKKNYLATLTGDRLIVFDRSGGAEVASHPFKVEYNTNCITPTAVRESDGTTSLFIAASNKGGRFEKLSFDGKSLSLVYSNENMRNFMNNAVLIDGYLYGVDGKHKKRNTRFTCMRYSDGKLMWEHNGLGCGSVISANGKLIILSEDGRLITAEVSPKAFTPISEGKILEGTCWTPPTLANGLVYARNQEDGMVCVDLRK